MKLLFDENLSPRLVAALADLFPESNHVDRMGMGSASDLEIWEHARLHGYTIVSKDSDFHERSLISGYPPKVVWIRRGNCTTTQIELLLRNHTDRIKTLLADPESAYLVIL